MTYLERYCNREYEQVWDELQALGSAVRQEPLYSDALAVARETMRLVRQTIEELIQRLIRIGFVFGYDHHLMQVVRGISSGIYDWADYVEDLSWVQEQPPVLLPGNLMEEKLASALRNGLTYDADTFRQEWHTDPMKPPVMPDYLDELEQAIGPVPLSIHAWYEEVGAVNFYGSHPRWPSMADCDPLHAFTLPDASVDACLAPWVPSPKEGELTFVQYLRWSLLEWAGFPGMTGRGTILTWPDDVKLPQDDLAVLTKDLPLF